LALAGEAGQSVRGGRAFRRGILPRRKVPGVLPGTPAGPALHPPAASYGDPEGQKLQAHGSCRYATHRVGGARCSSLSVRRRCRYAASSPRRSGSVASSLPRPSGGKAQR